MLFSMADETEKAQYVTAIYMRPSLWKKFRMVAVKRDLKIWQAIEEAVESWIKAGKAA